MKHRGRFLVAFSLVLGFIPAVARADLIGVRTGFYTKLSDPFVGVELILPVGHHLDLNPNVEYVFVRDHTHLTFNADAHYDFYGHGTRAFAWIGGGLALIYDSPPSPRPSSTDVGANVLFGVGLRGEVIPYIQAKVIAKRDAEFVIAFGLRF